MFANHISGKELVSRCVNDSCTPVKRHDKWVKGFNTYFIKNNIQIVNKLSILGKCKSKSQTIPLHTH
jgi:hypothetical protein